MQSFRGEMVVGAVQGSVEAYPQPPQPPPHTLQYFPSPAFSPFFMPLFVCSVGWILITALSTSDLSDSLIYFHLLITTGLPSLHRAPPCTTRTRWKKYHSKFKTTSSNKCQDEVATVEGITSVRMGGERRRGDSRAEREGHSLFAKSNDF